MSLPERDSGAELLSRASGLLCRASGQAAGHIQLFVEDVTQHSFLSTKSVGAMDLDQNPTYVV